ncbi:MAG: YbaB/EbfC family nucleoid-associated protein [Lewinellaceae bacterium]|nr:YbaB/EbfC family nucleoid-associated protein [Saprospiraceae bacterium]MCB9338886.1 YbaB/EbfC family nucleoid-associated protein [Lewinellaceae bacterium]
MFGDLFGNVQQQQEEMRRKLAGITVEAESGDGAIKIKANANREILDIAIDKEKLDWEDAEQLQDLLVTAINRVLEKAQVKEQAEANKMIQDLMPPGMGGLAGMFGQ